MTAAGAATVPAAAVGRAELRAFLHEGLAAVAGDAERILVVAIPAPRTAPERLLAQCSVASGVLWDPPQGRSVAGLGAAVRLDLHGRRRFAELRARAEGVFARVAVAAHPASAGIVVPRLYGGFAFAPGAASEAPWSEHGDGGFTLPRFLYTVDGERAAIALTVAGDEVARPAERLGWAEDLLDLRDVLLQPRPEDAADARPVRLARPSFASWAAQIEAIREAIAAGRVEKVVAARRSEVELGVVADAAAILGRLSRGLRSSTRYAFCRPRATFLGATPERLVSLRGDRFETEALAGSIGCGADQAYELLRSAKDLEEHRLVVEEIVRRLRPLSAELEVAPRPRIRELRDVLHLLTPIAGRLAAPRHVLELVEELHPTPAVGGVPTAEAVGWITAHEPARRGWYAGPIGWFDAQGDGDFAVALRGCVLQGRRAFLYAGAGIVRDSDPALESTETELKEQALLESLAGDRALA